MGGYEESMGGWEDPGDGNYGGGERDSDADEDVYALLENERRR